MARTGSSSIIHAMRKIVRLRAIYGAEDLADRTNADVATAIDTACSAFDAWWRADDHPGEIDITAPIIPGEDIGGP